MITVNFAQYPQFLSDFMDLLQKHYDSNRLFGLKKSDIFTIIMEEDFNIAVTIMPGEPFWVARISERDYTHFALKYA